MEVLTGQGPVRLRPVLLKLDFSLSLGSSLSYSCQVLLLVRGGTEAGLLDRLLSRAGLLGTGLQVQPNTLYVRSVGERRRRSAVLFSSCSFARVRTSGSDALWVLIGTVCAFLAVR